MLPFKALFLFDISLFQIKVIKVVLLLLFQLRFTPMQGWTATTRHEVTSKKEEKNEKTIGELFRKNTKRKGVYKL